MLSDKVALGGFLEYRSSTSSEARTLEDNSRTLHYGIYTRIHFTLKEKLVMYIQPRLSSAKYLGDNTPDGYFNLNVGTGAGLLYFITPKFGLNLVLGNINYSYTTFKVSKDKYVSNDFTFETVLNSPKLGISFYL
ncbi:hypothetical protein [Flammeovirga sp. SJP92]|uniref:hypothetical protein n=1 Tax=Flammeovirga sp. SJP92 TaxID=1775430 RepID=UPI000788F127|nr:hypothetical protein [Flammeovirga sp. SJP92]KXX72376.1 hypothetical protein AVL50_01885 [Flammeovirga sp. SJP92]